MSRTAITATFVTPQTPTVVTTTAGTTSGHTVDLTGVRGSQGCILTVTNGGGASTTATLRGTARDGLRGWADLAIVVPAGEARTVWISESMKFVQAGGVCNVDLSVATSVTLSVVVPKQAN